MPSADRASWCFRWTEAAGHIYQMVTAHNFAPGNAGVIFYMDIYIPLFRFETQRPAA